MQPPNTAAPNHILLNNIIYNQLLSLPFRRQLGFWGFGVLFLVEGQLFPATDGDQGKKSRD